LIIGLAMHKLQQLEEADMVTKVQKWGNSQGIRLSSKLLQEAHLTVGDEVDVTVQQGRIIVIPSKRIRGRYRLEDLVAQMPEDYEPHEENWGTPVGREVS
jgi:antitoxin MazE